jgi:uroporphyrin-III C-methyltransferase
MIPNLRYSINPKITLVGAGPGDPELISLKAIKVIKTADVLLYDALVSEELFEYAPEHSIKIYIGTHSDDQTYSQESVNKLMVDYAINYGHVVRLKSGDPFVFGRGFEELEYAASYSIPTEFVPGVSSVVSVPGLLGIPVTHQGISGGFLTVKGTDDEGNLSNEIYAAAKYSGTVVILMGIERLEEIANTFIVEGKGRLPVAVISNGSTKDEKIIVGVANTIAEAVSDAKIKSPVLIVFGDVVALHSSFQPIRESYEFVDGYSN